MRELETVRKLMLLGSLAPAAVGAGLAAWSGREVWAASQSQHWPAVAGRIQASQVDVRRCPCNPVMPKIAEYRASLHYTYQVAGVGYGSQRVSFGMQPSKSKYLSREFAHLYGEGKTVQVRYNPDDPAIAVLEPGVSYNVCVLPLVGVAMCVVGLVRACRMSAVGTINPTTTGESDDEYQRYAEQLADEEEQRLAAAP